MPQNVEIVDATVSNIKNKSPKTINNLETLKYLFI